MASFPTLEALYDSCVAECASTSAETHVEHHIDWCVAHRENSAAYASVAERHPDLDAALAATCVDTPNIRDSVLAALREDAFEVVGDPLTCGFDGKDDPSENFYDKVNPTRTKSEPESNFSPGPNPKLIPGLRNTI